MQYFYFFKAEQVGFSKHGRQVFAQQCPYMDHFTRIWHLSHRRAARPQTSLQIRTVSSESSLLACISMAVEECSDQTLDIKAYWIHVRQHGRLLEAS